MRDYGLYSIPFNNIKLYGTLEKTLRYGPCLYTDSNPVTARVSVGQKNVRKEVGITYLFSGNQHSLDSIKVR